MYFDTGFFPSQPYRGYRRQPESYNPYRGYHYDDEEEQEYLRQQELARRQQLARQQEYQRQQEYLRHQELLRQQERQRQAEEYERRRQVELERRKEMLRQRQAYEQMMHQKQVEALERRKHKEAEERARRQAVEEERLEKERQRIARLEDPAVRAEAATALQTMWRGRSERRHGVLERLRTLRKESERTHNAFAADQRFVEEVAANGHQDMDDQTLRHTYKRLLAYEEVLTRELLKLDGISPGPSPSVRAARKELVNMVNTRLSFVDGLKQSMIDRYRKIEAQLVEAAKERARAAETPAVTETTETPTEARETPSIPAADVPATTDAAPGVSYTTGPETLAQDQTPSTTESEQEAEAEPLEECSPRTETTADKAGGDIDEGTFVQIPVEQTQ